MGESQSNIVETRMNQEITKESSSRLHLKPLNLADVKKSREPDSDSRSRRCECIMCPEIFEITLNDQKNYLAHLLVAHQLVIADISQIGDFERYTAHWRKRFAEGVTLKEICFEIFTNTGAKDKGESERYFLLSDNLPEEKELRSSLNIYKLERALKQQESERNDRNFFRECIFCGDQVGNNRANLLEHMSTDHNFNIGLADNLVYFDEFYEKIRERFDRFQCLYCNKIFYNKQVLKEHMRKKQHKCINPANKEFDKFYIINYLEPGKLWQDLKHEKDVDEPEQNENGLKRSPSIEDWNDPVQTYFCLFCDESFELEDEILTHMKDGHQFDLKAVMAQQNLSFYNQVKLINYIRRQVLLNSCYICKRELESKADLQSHLEENEHIREFPSQELWDQPEYYFSTFEDDTLLCLLDDSAYSADEAKFQVIPEQLDLRINDELARELMNNVNLDAD